MSCKIRADFVNAYLYRCLRHVSVAAKRQQPGSVKFTDTNGLAGALTENDDLDGAQGNHEVQKKTLVLNIVEVVL